MAAIQIQQTDGSGHVTYYGAPSYKFANYLITVDSAGDIEIFVDGINRQSGSLTDDLTTGDNDHQISIGIGSLINNLGQSITLVFDSVLTENEIKSLSENPWQIFKPHLIRMGTPDAENQRLVVF